MDWTQAIDSYCERTGPEYWAEPVNAVTNAAFLIAALIMWRRTGAGRAPITRGLITVLALIGLGSFLFHTHGQVWSAIADTAPIALYVLTYIYAANRHYWGLSLWPALGLTVLFFPYAAATFPLFQMVPGLGSSAGYAPVPLLIFIYAFLLRRRLLHVARGLAIGAAILCLSIIFRSLDMPICGRLPLGTHFLWHILNALMLGWMIEVLHRYTTGASSAGRPQQGR
ncbi:ceramidase domain-containing protein [uncultured Shimia sp.]|uniref:ceramidase domain-containing protein n=1 Tax=uncultured Shimia sp. TaxID=573152 RepID=UPI002631C46D|nr:ceramidase domain-containing protein [uncultured Shimia sp.]